MDSAVCFFKSSIGKVLHCNISKKTGYLLFRSDITYDEISEIRRIYDVKLAFRSVFIICPVLEIRIKLALCDENITIIKNLAILISSLGKACKITDASAGILHVFCGCISFRQCSLVSIFRLEKSISHIGYIRDLVPYSEIADNIVTYRRLVDYFDIAFLSFLFKGPVPKSRIFTEFTGESSTVALFADNAVLISRLRQ